MSFKSKPKLIQLIHIAKSELGLEDDIYREVLANTTGKTSCKDMTIAQLDAVLMRLKQAGFAVKSKNAGVKNLASDAQSRLIRHIWLVMHQAGIVRNGSELALAKYIEKQTGVSALQFLSTDKASMVIEKLKKWADRLGVDLKLEGV